MRQALAGAAIAVAILCRSASADTAGITLDGLVEHPLHLTAADVAA